MTRLRPGLAALALALALGGCNRLRVFDPAAPEAHSVRWLIWLFIIICTAVYAAVMLALLWAMLRNGWGRSLRTAPPDPAPEPGRERRTGIVVGIGVALTVAILLGLTVATYAVNTRLFAHSGFGEVNIEVTGHQWWWELRYQDPDPSRTFTTANELHVPAGKLVRLVLRSPDVIHSLWLPNLYGKTDLIPGQENYFFFKPERPGLYMARCAEFCGFQHAFMGLDVVVDSPEDYEAWRAGQLAPAPEPRTGEQKRGLQVFTSGPCVLCHAVQGTIANANFGPNLTHLASRRSLAAGRFPNTRGYRGAWIADPQRHKPGVNMPPVILPPEDFQALLAYLDTLR